MSSILVSKPEGEAPPRGEPPKRARKAFTLVLVFLGIGSAATFGFLRYLHGLAYESTDDAFIEGTVVQVSPQVSGHVVRVFITDNQHVQAGQPLVQIDPRDYQTRLDQAKAALEASEAKLSAAEVDLGTVKKTAAAALAEADAGIVSAEAALKSAQARVAVSESALDQANAKHAGAQALVAQAQAEAKRAATDKERYQNLFKTGGVTASQLDQFATASKAADAALRAAQAQAAEAQAGVKTAQQTLAQSQSMVKEASSKVEEVRTHRASVDIVNERVARAEAEKSRAQADVKQAQAAVRQANLDLSYTEIRAVQAGTITRKSVEAGNYVRPGQALFGLVADDKWVVANFKETQLEKMRAGQAVTVHVDAYPGMDLKAKVDSIQLGTGARFSLLPAENATGNYVKVVQRIPVKIVFTDPLPPDRPLSLGMSVVPDVKVK